MARWLVQLVGAVCVLAGLVWFFQGIGVLRGSFMTGSLLWAVIGAVLLILGAGLLLRDQRRGRHRS